MKITRSSQFPSWWKIIGSNTTSSGQRKRKRSWSWLRSRNWRRRNRIRIKRARRGTVLGGRRRENSVRSRCLPLTAMNWNRIGLRRPITWDFVDIISDMNFSTITNRSDCSLCQGIGDRILLLVTYRDVNLWYLQCSDEFQIVLALEDHKWFAYIRWLVPSISLVMCVCEYTSSRLPSALTVASLAAHRDATNWAW